MKKPRTKPRVNVTFLGYQVWRRGRFALYNLLEDMPGHPAGSTVSRNTIELQGYVPVLDGKALW